MSENPIITFQNVGMSFGSTEVHKDITFSVNRGEAVTILGPSGTGKTVVLRLVIGLLFATKGSVNVLGLDLNTASEDDLVDLRRRVGILFQGAALFDSLSVYENIAYPLRERGEKNESKIEKIVKERLEVVNLNETINKYPTQLSGGQKKRIGLARALASSPEIMLFDEPTTGLDPTAVRLIDDLAVRLRKELNMTSLIVTHDIGSAKRISTRWMLLRNGLKVADGSPDLLSETDKEVMEFISGFADYE
jgi:phospholipid/cholesterol/gamma-HCH transport system ATP-binding protein